jgi:hypothetical protein
MRLFFGIDGSSRVHDSNTGTTTIDASSCISASTLTTGTVKGSILSNVRCKHIEAEDCVLINVTAERIIAPKGSVVYNVCEGSREGLVLVEGKVLAGVFAADGSLMVMNSTTATDGGKNPEGRIYVRLCVQIRWYALTPDCLYACSCVSYLGEIFPRLIRNRHWLSAYVPVFL